ncbi:similar to Saccharomyces cerevisiae YIL137C TMA108 Protein that associates with ribosomes and is involved in ribosome biogenesis [Maudiozyma barnettii]|uniref:Aminopeptidase n=1 Tax=Maudiozyma barnettii TaxID=61262 RepID=A0A8H2ZFI2_9SACH|nr:Tma108p [Kazachstania barnettii]CAB4253256.1 similar to Saccharomyces cerevisiae YIL137C TMA108 Protein that associates with ribosomes and is involved in ribosome biogenesis [Kazachstania barnettii]CAD1780208.1 similar to Saccharomyces cerevisiae YIL137C TMA108 Protein that associates with ribosomes and is involved in ribosome biogenesis [Kazachstania barnettii]
MFNAQLIRSRLVVELRAIAILVNITRSNIMKLLSLENPLIPSQYDLNIEIDPLNTKFNGIITITLNKNKNIININEFSKFKLHGKNLSITSAVLLNDDNTTINLKVTPVIDQEQFLFESHELLSLNDNKYRLTIEYQGTINQVKTPNDKTHGLFISNFMKNDIANNYILATHCQPSFARLIFPCIDELSIKTSFILTIKSLRRFSTVSVSKIDSIVENDDESSNMKTTVFEKTELLPTSLFGFVIGDLEEIHLDLPSTSKDSTNLPITIYSPLKVTQATYTLDIVQKYLPLLSKFFNCKFPSNKLDFVLLPFLNDMVMENFTMITVQMDFLLFTPQSLANTSVRNQTIQLVVHELVHQWMGNYISFNSWEYLPFNESFATFLAYYLISQNDSDNNVWATDNYLQNELGMAMIQDSDLPTSKSIHDSYHQRTNFTTTTTTDLTTNDLFDPISYQKGIAMLRMLQLSMGEDLFQNAMAQVFEDKDTFHNIPVKPMDIFHKMGQVLKSENVTNFVSSWTRLPGLPIVSVQTEIDEASKSLKSTLTQHRFYSSENIDPEFNQDTIEDTPYHITLLTQLPGKLNDTRNTLMTDRSLKLDYPVTLLNCNSQGYYRVSYETQECYDEICKELTLGNIDDISLFKIFQDISFFLGNKFFQKSIHISGTMQILNHIASSPKDITLKSLTLWKSLSEGLSLLQTIVQAAVVHNRRAIITKITKLVTKLSEKVDDWSVETLSQVHDSYELSSLSKIIALTSTTKPTEEICQELFKHIRQGPKDLIPIELVSSIYMTVSYQMTSIKDWKKLFELVKTSSGIASHIIDFNSTSENEKIITLQNLAITNLGFVTTEELITRLLNFIDTNIAAGGIENAFIGANYNAQVIINKKDNTKVRDAVWKWFKLHYSGWKRNLTKNGASDGRGEEKLEKITFMVLQMFVESSKLIEKYEKFEEIKPVWETLQREDRSNCTIISGFSK